jgi:hypothetical protein
MHRPLSLSARSRFDPGTSHDDAVAVGDVVDLSESNPTRVGLAGPVLASEIFRSAPVEPYAPDPLGLASARQAIAKKLRGARNFDRSWAHRAHRQHLGGVRVALQAPL